MKFYIRKSSQSPVLWDNDDPEDQPEAPVEGCVRLEKVFEHKMELTDYLWTIEIETLEELVELSKIEDIIVRGDTIEIYDSLRE